MAEAAGNMLLQNRVNISAATTSLYSNHHHMFCLRWWLLMFLLPFPTAPTLLLSLFMLSYLIYQKPCPYCFVLLLCLFGSTCNWDVGSSLAPSDNVINDIKPCWFRNTAHTPTHKAYELDLRAIGSQLIIEI